MTLRKLIEQQRGLMKQLIKDEYNEELELEFKPIEEILAMPDVVSDDDCECLDPYEGCDDDI